MGVDKKIFFVLVFMISTIYSFGQTKAVLYGTITDSDNEVLYLANISVIGSTQGVTSDAKGQYRLEIHPNVEQRIKVQYVGYKERLFFVHLKAGEERRLDVQLSKSISDLQEVEIKDQQIRPSNIARINPNVITDIPSVSGGIEDILPAIGGVVKNNELSSQYNVRGGNYDENLIYVNDFEIYRPQLIRSGQQEGLSFINSDMVRSIQFSAGGFPAKFGDKLSSVLDIQYKKPTKFGGSLTLGLLGLSAQVEGTAAKGKFQYLAGYRRKTSKNLLNTLDTQGEYRPSYNDFQTWLNYDFNNKVSMSFLGYIGVNEYNFVPETRNTEFGTANEAYQLNVIFFGQEKDSYNTYFGGWSTSYSPNKNLSLKLVASAYQSTERETFDIEGYYRIGQLENNPAAEDFGQAKDLQGFGGEIKHARNRLYVDVFNVEQKGNYQYNRHNLQWGVKYQHESINDRIREYSLIDSLDFALPIDPIQIGDPNPDHPEFVLDYSIRSKYTLNSNRVSAYLQNTFQFEDNSGGNYQANIGLRSSYWDLNKEFFITPRASLSYKPKWENDIQFNLSGGLYYQTPFYKELRNLKGEVNTDVLSQKSWQVVTGVEWNFTWFDRPFKLVSEAYYKGLWDVNPYIIDNVRIRYYGNNSAKGFAKGIDLRLNGEFIPGMESYASISLLDTKEIINNSNWWNYYDDSGFLIYQGNEFEGHAADSVQYQAGYIRRPSDQMLTASFFFQDNLPINPTYKVHLRFVFGTTLPLDNPNIPRSASGLANYRTGDYKRIDVGFSKQIIGDDIKYSDIPVLKHIKSMSLNVEIFNLLDIPNVASYEWIKSTDGRTFAIPNNLTGRQFNFRLITKF